ETWGYREKEPYLAASIVKLPLMAAILLLKSRGETSFDDTITIREDQKIPGCGAVQFLNGDVTLTVGELCKLMITISDSCATNVLFRHYGAERIHEKFLELGLIGTQFNREYWDLERENRGINNYFVPEEMGILLKKMYDRTLVDAESSAWLENILRQQQINHKMGGFLPMDFPMAHKTGDEEDKAHDVGIVFAEKPFILCYAYIGNNMQVYEDFIRRTTRTLAEDAGSIEAVMARLAEQE
ncbi:MAG: serine hydrolase, partial [Anaerovoracaceae bacterium]